MRKSPKILILGHGGHGKDEFASMLANKLNVNFSSSSEYSNEKIIYPWFKKHFPLLYRNSQECFASRRDWRSLWHLLISEYNKEDKTRLAKEIMSKNDIYVGMRSIEELKACLNARVFDKIFWVDASKRIPLESKASNSIEYDFYCMTYIDNNKTIEDLSERANVVASVLLKN